MEGEKYEKKYLKLWKQRIWLIRIKLTGKACVKKETSKQKIDKYW